MPCRRWSGWSPVTKARSAWVPSPSRSPPSPNTRSLSKRRSAYEFSPCSVEKRLRGMAGWVALFVPCLTTACSLANSDPPIDDVEVADLGKPTVDAGSRARGLDPADQRGFPHGSDVNTDPDYIELINRGTGQISLRGYKVRDDGATWITLPDDAAIAAGGLYLINCDDEAKSGLPGAHVAFKLGGSGIRLTSQDPTVVNWTASPGAAARWRFPKASRWADYPTRWARFRS